MNPNRYRSSAQMGSNPFCRFFRIPLQSGITYKKLWWIELLIIDLSQSQMKLSTKSSRSNQPFSTVQDSGSSMLTDEHMPSFVVRVAMNSAEFDSIAHFAIPTNELIGCKLKVGNQWIMALTDIDLLSVNITKSKEIKILVKSGRDWKGVCRVFTIPKWPYHSRHWIQFTTWILFATIDHQHPKDPYRLWLMCFRFFRWIHHWCKSLMRLDPTINWRHNLNPDDVESMMVRFLFWAISCGDEAFYDEDFPGASSNI